ncbi:MAG TPA: hypothetical protein VGF17_08895, partial [Phytomonospora sp.]
MLLRTRLFALTVVGVCFLLGNAYSGAVLVTLTSEPVTADLDDCSGFLWGDCKGSWTDPDGVRETGYITGPYPSRQGETMPIQTGPLGAYSGGWAANWPRLIFDAAVDLAILTAVVFTRGRARMRGCPGTAPPSPSTSSASKTTPP